MSEDIKRVKDEADPNRCQATNSQGQCMNVSVEHGDMCLAHGGNMQENKHKRIELNNYRLDKQYARAKNFAESEHSKNLRDEIGILRMVLEEKLNQVSDNFDLVLNAGPISDLILKIEKLVTSCHKLEGSMGQLLDKPAILTFASEVIKIITDVISDEMQVSIIANKITALVGRSSDDS